MVDVDCPCHVSTDDEFNLKRKLKNLYSTGKQQLQPLTREYPTSFLPTEAKDQEDVICSDLISGPHSFAVLAIRFRRGEYCSREQPGALPADCQDHFRLSVTREGVTF